MSYEAPSISPLLFDAVNLLAESVEKEETDNLVGVDDLIALL